MVGASALQMDRSQSDAPTLFGVGCLFVLLVIAVELWPSLELHRGLVRSLDGAEQWQMAGANISPPTAAMAAGLVGTSQQEPSEQERQSASLRWQSPSDRSAPATLEPPAQPAAGAHRSRVSSPPGTLVAELDQWPIQQPTAEIERAAPGLGGPPAMGEQGPARGWPRAVATIRFAARYTACPPESRRPPVAVVA